MGRQGGRSARGRSARLSRGGAAVVFVVVLVVALGVFFGLRTLLRTAEDTFTTSGCDVGDYSVSTEQASVAAQMIAAVTDYRRPLPPRAGVLVLMAALQESKLTNVPPGEGDRDSVGVLQQRPSQGWGHGSAQQLTDVTEATTEFLNALVKVRGWRDMAPADAIQAVQVSADGSAYAQHQPEAQVLAAAFSGRRPAAVTCQFDAPTVVAAPAQVAALVRRQLPVTGVRVAARAVRVPAAGWQTAAWFVANADRLGIAQVDCRGRRWTRADGWQRVPAGAGTAVIATMATAAG